MATQTTTVDVRGETALEPLDRLMVAALRDLSIPPGKLLQEMIIDFLDDAPAHLAEVRRALDDEYYPVAARAAHRLKAAGALLGAMPLAVLAARIERAAWATDGEGAASYAEAAATELGRVLSAARALQC